MSSDGLIIILALFLLALIWIPDEELTITPKNVNFAVSSCKEGKWKSIDKLNVICKDGATYKLKQENKL